MLRRFGKYKIVSLFEEEIETRCENNEKEEMDGNDEMRNLFFFILRLGFP